MHFASAVGAMRYFCAKSEMQLFPMVSCWLPSCPARQKGIFCKLRKLNPINNEKDGFCKCMLEWGKWRDECEHSFLWKLQFFQQLVSDPFCPFLISIHRNQYCLWELLWGQRVWIFTGTARNDMGLYMCRVCVRSAQVPITWTSRVCTI